MVLGAAFITSCLVIGSTSLAGGHSRHLHSKLPPTISQDTSPTSHYHSAGSDLGSSGGSAGLSLLLLLTWDNSTPNNTNKKPVMLRNTSPPYEG